MHSILLLTYSLVLLLIHPVSSSSPHSWKFSQFSHPHWCWPHFLYQYQYNHYDSWSTSKPGFPTVVCVASSRCHERGSTPETELDYQWLYHLLVIKRMVDSHPSPLKLGLQVEVLLDRQAVSQRHKVVLNTMPLKTIIQDGPPQIAKNSDNSIKSSDRIR